MFDIGWGELVVIGVVALIVIGPKELPTVLRTVGQWMTKIRRMAAEFQGQFQEAMREAELADLKKQVDAASDLTRGVSDFNPLETVRKEMEGAFEAGTKPAATTEPITSATPAPAAEMPAGAAAEPVVTTAEASQPADGQPAEGGEPAPPLDPAAAGGGRAA